jgi:hypothetical protein
MEKLKLAAPMAVMLSAAGCTEAMNLLAGEPLSNPEGTQIAQAPPGINGQFEWSGSQASVQGRSTRIADTEPEWQELWQLAGTPAPGPLPQGWMGVGVFLGMRRSAGYSVAIEGITERVTGDTKLTDQGLPTTRELVISYGEQPPKPMASVAQVLTSPYVIRLVQRSDLPPRFVQVR